MINEIDAARRNIYDIDEELSGVVDELSEINEILYSQRLDKMVNKVMHIRNKLVKFDVELLMLKRQVNENQ